MDFLGGGGGAVSDVEIATSQYLGAPFVDRQAVIVRSESVGGVKGGRSDWSFRELGAAVKEIQVG